MSLDGIWSRSLGKEYGGWFGHGLDWGFRDGRQRMEDKAQEDRVLVASACALCQLNGLDRTDRTRSWRQIIKIQTDKLDSYMKYLLNSLCQILSQAPN